MIGGAPGLVTRVEAAGSVPDNLECRQREGRLDRCPWSRVEVSVRDLIDRFNAVQGEVNATRMSTFRGFCG